VLLFGCAGPAEISDSGYTGRWERRIGRTRSVVSFWEEGGEMRFCWNQITENVPRRIRCDSKGVAEYLVNREKIYEYRFRTSVEETTGHLLLHVEGAPPVEGEATPIVWVDRLELQPGGLELWSYRLELNDTVHPKPMGPVKFVKISDDPF
jgi:hypothetical protein